MKKYTCKQLVDDFDARRIREEPEVYLASDVDARIVELEKAHARYEHVRRLNPHQFRELWERNLRGEGPFDALVDSAISLMER